MMLNGLDLFSGVGGITLALEPWVRPVAYCENDRYAQSVLISRMVDGSLPNAPIWDDVRTLSTVDLPDVDIITGGFPCQDISTAGNGLGLEGKRSGLFFEIMRLAKEIKPQFIFLENVPAIRTRGLNIIGHELASIGYDCRWNFISAYEVGAPHKRERWFCLASNSVGERLEAQRITSGLQAKNKTFGSCGGWKVEPNVDRVADGVSMRMDRIRCLGNAVVPKQARQAFQELMYSSYLHDGDA